VNAEFNWGLLIVGLVIGSGLVWLVLADSRRREVDVTEQERAGEARWIAEAMADAGARIDDEDVREVLRLHAEYLAAGPPDEDPLVDAGEPGALGMAAGRRPAPVHPAIVHDPDRGPMAHPLPRPDGEGGAA
jgi:hypothetical protein